MAELRSIIQRMAGAGAVHALFLHALVIVLGYCVHLLLANLLGASDYGLYYYILSWIGMIVVLAAFGLPNAVVKYVGEYQALERRADLKGLILWALRITVAMSLAAVLVWLIVVRLSTTDSAGLYLVAAVIIPLLALTRVVRGLLRSFKWIGWTYSPQLSRHIGILCGCGALLLLRGRVSVTDAFIVTIVAVSIGLLLGLARLTTGTRELRMTTASYSDKSRWISVAWPLMLLGSFSLLINQTDILMIGLIRNSTDVGIYQAASRTAGLTSMVLVTASVAIGPQVAHAFGAGDVNRLRIITRSAAQWIFWPSFLIALLFCVFSDSIVTLFGPGFESSAPLLVILVVGHLFTAGAGVSREVLSFTGFQKEASAILAGAVMCNIILNGIGISFYGTTGAAVATATTFLVLSVAMVIATRKYLKVRADLFGSWKTSNV